MPLAISEYVPQCAAEGRARVERRTLAVWCALASLALVVSASVVVAPLLSASGHAPPATLIYEGFGAVCHQIRERSFHALGFPLAVCARCTGLYAGFALGVLLYPLVRPLGSRGTPPRAWLIAASIPTAVDFALGFFGVWENTHLSRALTGALLGAVAALYVVPGLVDLSHARRGQLFGVRGGVGE